MKTFIKKCVLFLLLFFPVILTYSTVRTSLHRVYILDETTHTIFIGDSQVQCALITKRMTGIQNIAVDSEGYLFSFQKLKKILPANPQIKTVILGFSYHSVSSYYDNYMTGSEASHILPRYVDLFSYNELLELVRTYPLLIGPALKKFVCLGNDPYPYIGSYINADTARQSFRKEVMTRRVKFQFYDGDTVRGISRINISYFNKIVKLCRKQGVDLILVRPPLHKEFRKQIPQTHVAEYERIVAESALPTYNFLSLNLTDGDFLPDGDHVNGQGAVLTTDYFMAHWKGKVQALK